MTEMIERGKYGIWRHWRGWQDWQGWRRFSLAMLFAMCLLPFLVPLHTLPATGFYAEWLALALGLAALPGLMGYLGTGIHTGIVLPRVALLPAGLALLLLVQRLWLPASLHAAALLGLLYLLWAGLLMVVTATLLRSLSPGRLTNWLALALFLAALANACNALLFKAGLGIHNPWLLLRTYSAAYIGQRNMLADLLWLGIVSALYHWHQGRRYSFVWLILLLPLLTASACIGARAPMLYALWLALAASVWGSGRLRRAAVCVCVTYFALVLAVHYAPMNVAVGDDSLMRTMSGAHFTSGHNIRLDLIAVATLIFLAHPLLGAGWGSFAWESYSRAGDEGGVGVGVGVQAAAEHAHQFFLQLAAELGIAAPLLALLVLAMWVWPLWRARVGLRQQTEYWWAICAAGIILIHSQLEYPLWYAHMLGVCAILLACAEQRVIVTTVTTWRASAVSGLAVMAIGGYLLATCGKDYRHLDQWLAHDMLRTETHVPDGYYQLLVDLHRDSLLQAEAVRVLAVVMPPTSTQLAGKLEICRLALHSEPQSPAVFTCALLEGLAGNTQQSTRDMHQAMLIFGDYLPDYLRRLDATLTAEQRAKIALLLPSSKK